MYSVLPHYQTTSEGPYNYDQIGRISQFLEPLASRLYWITSGVDVVQLSPAKTAGELAHMQVWFSKTVWKSAMQKR